MSTNSGEGSTGDANGDDTTKKPAFKVGELVTVEAEHRVGRADSGGGQASVKAVKPPEGSSDSPTKYDVKYVLGRLKSPEVKETRLQPTTLETTSRKRKSDDVDRPPLLSVHHDPVPSKKEDTTKPATKRVSKPTSIKSVNCLLLEGKSWTVGSGVHPICGYIHSQRKKSKKGWMREAESKHAGFDEPPTGHLSSEEKLKLFLLKTIMNGLSGPSVVGAPIQDLAFAWGVSKSTVKKLDRKVTANIGQLTFDRKTRSDKGQTVFNNRKKQSQFFTPKAFFIKEQHKNAKGLGKLTSAELDEKWEALSEEKKKTYNLMAEEALQRAPFLQSEIGSILRATNGSITWRGIASQLSSGGVQIISKDTIRRHQSSVAGEPGRQCV